MKIPRNKFTIEQLKDLNRETWIHFIFILLISCFFLILTFFIPMFLEFGIIFGILSILFYIRIVIVYTLIELKELKLKWPAQLNLI